MAASTLGSKLCAGRFRAPRGPFGRLPGRSCCVQWAHDPDISVPVVARPCAGRCAPRWAHLCEQHIRGSGYVGSAMRGLPPPPTKMKVRPPFRRGPSAFPPRYGRRFGHRNPRAGGQGMRPLAWRKSFATVAGSAGFGARSVDGVPCGALMCSQCGCVHRV
jgi:hypothetical protein